MTTARLPKSPPLPITTPEQALERAFQLLDVGEDDQHAIKVMVSEAAALIDETLRSEAVRTQMAERLGTALKAWPTAPAPPGLRWEERTRPYLLQPITVTMTRPDGAQFRAPDDLDEEKRLREALIALHAKINFRAEKKPGAPVGVERIFGGELHSRMSARNMEPASALVTGLLAFFIGVERTAPRDDEVGFRKRWEGVLQRGGEAEKDVPNWARAS